MEGGTGDVDVVAAMVNPGGACVHLISVRGGRVLGSKNFFPQVAIEEEGSDVLLAFLAQYYLSSQERDLPSELIVNAQHDDFPTLIAAIDESRGRELSISYRVRGTRARWHSPTTGSAMPTMEKELQQGRKMVECRINHSCTCFQSRVYHVALDRRYIIHNVRIAPHKLNKNMVPQCITH